MKNNMQLYEKIMRNISREIKHILNEDIQNFDVTDYSDESNDIITDHEITHLSMPKTLKEEEERFIYTEPSEESMEKAQMFISGIEKIAQHLNETVYIPEEILKDNDNNYELYGRFILFSRNDDSYIDTAFEYAFISVSYDTMDKKFKVQTNKEDLAKMIEYSDAYEAPMVFSFIGNEKYFYAFQKYLNSNIAQCFEIWIWPKGFYTRPEYNDKEVDDLFFAIHTIYINFIVFTDSYIKDQYYKNIRY